MIPKEMMNMTTPIERALSYLFYTLIGLLIFTLILNSIPTILGMILLIGFAPLTVLLGIAFPIEKIFWKDTSIAEKVTADDIVFSGIFCILLFFLYIFIVVITHGLLTNYEGALFIIMFYGLETLLVFFKVPKTAYFRIRGLFLRGDKI